MFKKSQVLIIMVKMMVKVFFVFVVVFGYVTVVLGYNVCDDWILLVM